MREIKLAERGYTDEQGRTHRLRYCLLEETADGGAGRHTGYGVAVLDEGGDEMRLRDLSTDRTWVRSVVERLAQGLVTPVTAGDVVEDLLFQH